MYPKRIANKVSYNSHVCPFNAVTTYCCHGCNTAMVFLGSACQSNGTQHYLDNYLCKDCGKITAILPMLKSVVETIEQHKSPIPSLAASEQELFAKRSLTRLLNTLHTCEEVSAQVAAATFRGNPSSFYSHQFTLCRNWNALFTLLSNAGDDDDAMQDDTDNEESEDDADVGDADEVRYAMPDHLADNSGGRGGAMLVKTDDNKVTAVSQCDFYRHRGPELASMSFYVWCAVVNITRKVGKKKKPSDNDKEEEDSTSDDNDDEEGVEAAAVADIGKSKGKGRRPNGLFEFDSTTTFQSKYTQRLRSLHKVPIMAGKPPPLFPKRQKDDASWKRRAGKAGAYYLTAFCPWDIETHKPPFSLDYQGFLDWIGPMLDSKSYRDRAIVSLVSNMCSSGVENKQGELLIDNWRRRCAKRWEHSLPTKPFVNNMDGAQCDEPNGLNVLSIFGINNNDEMITEDCVSAHNQKICNAMKTVIEQGLKNMSPVRIATAASSGCPAPHMQRSNVNISTAGSMQDLQQSLREVNSELSNPDQFQPLLPPSRKEATHKRNVFGK